MTLTPDLITVDSELEKAKELLETLLKIEDTLLKIEDTSKALNFLTIKDLIKSTGWSNTTVQNLFNRPDFPSCDFGKEKVVEIHAALQYFSVPRRKESLPNRIG